jgi:hypothetical protein
MLATNQIRITNARLYPPPVMDELERALAGDNELSPDPVRRNVFELKVANI